MLAVQGPEQVAELLPDIIAGCRARNAGEPTHWGPRARRRLEGCGGAGTCLGAPRAVHLLHPQRVHACVRPLHHPSPAHAVHAFPPRRAPPCPPPAAVREGHLTLFKYLPLCMPDDFVQHLPQVKAVKAAGCFPWGWQGEQTGKGAGTPA